MEFPHREREIGLTQFALALRTRADFRLLVVSRRLVAGGGACGHTVGFAVGGVAAAVDLENRGRDSLFELLDVEAGRLSGFVLLVLHSVSPRWHVCQR